MGGRQEAAGQEPLTRETSAPNPEDFLADVGLEPIEGEEDPTLQRRQLPQTRGVLEGARDQCVIALQQIGDWPRRDSATPLDHRLMESRDTGVVGRAPRAKKGEDSEAKRVLGQGQAPCRVGSVRFAHLGTRRIEAPPHLEGEVHDSLQGCDGTIVVLGGPHGLTAAGTLAHNRLQSLCRSWGRSGCGTGQRYHLHLSG
jgi:hypothetical protein